MHGSCRRFTSDRSAGQTWHSSPSQTSETARNIFSNMKFIGRTGLVKQAIADLKWESDGNGGWLQPRRSRWLIIAVRGSTPVDASGKTVGIGDVFEQTKQCFEIIKPALEESGSGLQDIVRTRVILTDIDNWKQAIEARKLYCIETRPVDTITAIDRFINPAWLVEIEVDAVVAD